MENPKSTCQIFNGDCLEKMKDLDDKSIDLIFCDLPYGQTSCKWDCKIDLELFWKQVMRIKKLNTPIFMTTTTKFGVSLIQSAPKKCFFRYDLVWVKSAPAGFLSAKKMPMRKHEMVYVFYEKLPFYDLSSHQHKFIKEGKKTEEEHNGIIHSSGKVGITGQERKKPLRRSKKGEEKFYDPPLPVSVVKEINNIYGFDPDKMIDERPSNVRTPAYDPPLPVSVVKEELDEKYKNKGGLYSKISRNGLLKAEPHYDPPLPVSVVKEGEPDCYDFTNRLNNGKLKNFDKELYIGRNGGTAYEPPLPTTMLEIKSTRGKHSTEKPVQLMEWIFKYYSKEGDVILDPTMGSGSTGVACKNMNRNFIGIEMDEEIFKVAEERLK